MQSITYRIATVADYPLAQSLVAEEYERQGYINSLDREAKSEFLPYLEQPTSKTVIGVKDGVVVATISLIPDSAIGLPMDKLYQAELNLLRQQKVSLAEVGQFAVSHAIPGLTLADRLRIPTMLFSAVYQISKTAGIQSLCITVNPKHERLYQSLGFQVLGETKAYTSVNGAPAVPHVLHLEQFEYAKNVSPLMRQIMNSPLMVS